MNMQIPISKPISEETKFFEFKEYGTGVIYSKKLEYEFFEDLQKHKIEFISVTDNTPSNLEPDKITMLRETLEYKDESFVKSLETEILSFREPHFIECAKNDGFYVGVGSLISVTAKTNFFEVTMGGGGGAVGLEVRNGKTILNFPIAPFTVWSGLTINHDKIIDSITEIYTEMKTDLKDEYKQTKQQLEKIKQDFEALNTPEGGTWFIEKLRGN